MNITVKSTDEVFAEIGAPGQIVIVGWNYRDHTPGGDGLGPAEPIWYPLSPYSLNRGEVVPYPDGMERVEMEAELVVVIGREARKVSRGDALDYVYGYACGNDVSCRDIQNHKERPNLPVAKTFDGFCPIGGSVVSGIDVSDIVVTGRLNGDVVMRDSTKHMFFSVPELIEHITRYHVLRPGDLIFTGTPRSSASTIVKPGDVMEVEIEGVGKLRNVVG